MAKSSRLWVLVGFAIACGSASNGSGNGGDAGSDASTCQCSDGEECIDGQCVAASCTDLAISGFETDIDCGGDCPGCSEGQSCKVASDCQSRFCNSEICRDCTGNPDCAGAPGTTCVDGTCRLPTECASSLSGWHALGDPLDAVATAGSDAVAPKLIIDSSNRPIVAWAEGSPFDTYVARFESGAWQPLGGPITADAMVGTASPTALGEGGGVLALGFIESSDFHLWTWNGSAWNAHSGSPLNTTNADGGDILVDDAGDMLVSWSQYSDGYIGRSRIQVRRVTSSSIDTLGPEIGGIAGPGASAISPNIGIDSTGREVVAFTESGGRVRRRTAGGDGWESLGPDEVLSAIGSTSGASGPHLAIDSAGVPMVAVTEYDTDAGETKAFALRFGGSGWDVLGGALDEVGGEHSSVYDLAIDGNDQPVVAWTEASTLYLQRWNGEAWIPIGSGTLSSGAEGAVIFWSSTAVDQCGRVVVAFVEEAGGADKRIHVYRRYD